MLAFESGVENGTDEGMELDVALALTGLCIDGCFRVGLRAFGGNQLGVEACLPGGEFFQEFRTRVSGFIGGMNDSDGAVGGIAEPFVVRLFCGCLRMAFEVARVDYVIELLLAFANDFAIGITKNFLAVDCAFLLYCAVEFGEGVIEFYVSHNCMVVLVVCTWCLVGGVAVVRWRVRTEGVRL